MNLINMPGEINSMQDNLDGGTEGSNLGEAWNTLCACIIIKQLLSNIKLYKKLMKQYSP